METSDRKDKLDYGMVNRIVLSMLEPPRRGWYMLFGVALVAVCIGATCWTKQIFMGMGESGKNSPVGWGFYITNFVFWVGIAHSGTLISAVLYLFRAKFRMPIYRIAEAMTVFAVLTAALFPIVHMARPWFFYWTMPIPTERTIWPNFRSPLLWDVFAVSTYLTVSSIFFISGLIPDIAAARDRAKSKFRKLLYSVTSLGWSGSYSQWKHYTSAYLLFAALATPLVVSVHSVVSWDFAMSIIPGWHSAMFPPYFVAGAIFSGVAMVLTLSIPIRKFFHLEAIIRINHFEAMAKLLMATSMIVTYSYIFEFYIAWYSGNQFEKSQFLYRAFGDYALPFWIMLACNCVIPLLLWFKRCRTSVSALFLISLFVNVGMWFERFNIISQSLSHDFLPSSWGLYNFSWVDFGITLGGFGWFGMWMLLFIKFFPAVSLSEIKEIMPPPLRDKSGVSSL